MLARSLLCLPPGSTFLVLHHPWFRWLVGFIIQLCFVPMVRHIHGVATAMASWVWVTSFPEALPLWYDCLLMFESLK